jgi:hypothetical protein
MKNAESMGESGSRSHTPGSLVVSTPRRPRSVSACFIAVAESTGNTDDVAVTPDSTLADTMGFTLTPRRAASEDGSTLVVSSGVTSGVTCREGNREDDSSGVTCREVNREDDS